MTCLVDAKFANRKVIDRLVGKETMVNSFGEVSAGRVKIMPNLDCNRVITIETELEESKRALGISRLVFFDEESTGTAIPNISIVIVGGITTKKDGSKKTKVFKVIACSLGKLEGTEIEREVVNGISALWVTGRSPLDPISHAFKDLKRDLLGIL